MAFNRWQFNRPKYVGRLAEAIRRCAPRTEDEWRSYYLENVRPEGQMFGQTMEQHLEEVGRRLFVKITEQLRLEIENVTEEDCLEYVKQVVFHRTFEGYMLEKQTIYEQIQTRIGLPLMPAPDEWDRKYNVDFYIEVKSKYIGIQVKPISYKDFDHMGSWKEWMHESHKAFEEK